MTSIVSPSAYASHLAATAQERLASASTMLRSSGPRPLEAQHGGGFAAAPPTHGGGFGFIPPYVHSNGALRLADGAITDIVQALGLGQQLSTGVRTAFDSALTAAREGVNLLTAGLLAPGGEKIPALRFDAAGMWLGLAKNLLSLEHDPGSLSTIQPIALPAEQRLDAEILPIQLPSPDNPMPAAPGDPGSPITIQPIALPAEQRLDAEILPIQLPSPDGPIQ